MIHEPFPEPALQPDRQVRRHLFGEFRLPNGNPHGAWIELAHELASPSPIVCSLRYPTPLTTAYLVPLDRDRELRFDLRLPFDGTLRLHSIGGGSYGQDKAKFEPGAYDLLEKETAIPAGSSVHAAARLSHRGFMGYTFGRILRPDGTVERLGEDRARVSWCRGDIDFTLDIRHEYDPAHVGRDRGTIVAQRPWLFGKWTQPEDTDTSTLLDKAAEALGLPLLCLSLLSRRSIQWYELHLFVTTDEAARKHVEVSRRVRFWPDDLEDPDEEPLLPEEEAASGWFGRVLTALEESAVLADLSRAIRYHLGSFAASHIESRFILSFAAFETLVNTLDSTEPLFGTGLKDIGPLERALKRVVKCFVARRELPKPAAESLRTKIAEIRRPAFLPKALHHLERLQVDSSRLWVDDRTGEDKLRAGLDRTAKARNLLVHNTTLGELVTLNADLARLQCLFERLLLSALGTPRRATSRALAHAHRLRERW